MSRAEEMESLLSRWASSGLTQRAFAEHEGVPYSTLLYWRRRLSRKKTTRPRRRAEIPELAPVRIVPDAARSAPSFEVRTPSGLTVSVPTGFDEGELSRLLGTLQGC